MSGLELAGVILAIFPVIVEGVELYVKGAHTIARWWRFPKVLKRLLRRIELERVKFQDNCEVLLWDITQPGQLERLMNDPGGPEWTRPDLQQKLEKQLGRSYRVYMEAASEIKELLEEFRAKLVLDQSGKPKWADAQRYQREWKRIRITLTETGNESLLDQLRKNNADLRGLLGHQNQMLAARDSHVVRSIAMSYQEHRRQVNSLYTALETNFANGRACGCCTPHHASICLSRNKISHRSDCRTAAGEIGRRSHFVVLFALHTTSSPDLTSSPRSCEWRMTTVSNAQLAGGHKIIGRDQGALGGQVTPPHTPLGHAWLSTGPSAATSIPPENLCIALNTKVMDAAGLMILQGNQNWQHRIDIGDKFGLPGNAGMVNIKDALSRGIERKVRLSLAVKLASSVLQLQTTSWMPDRWSSSDIHVVAEKGAQLETGHGFVSAAFPARGSKAPAPQHHSSSETRNVSLFALGIALIELCYGKALENLDPKSDGTPMSAREVMAAVKGLTEQIYLEAGESYGDAVRRCIYCDFDQRYTDLDYPEMIDAVHRGVCEPLEATLYAFCGGKIGDLVD